VLSSGNTTSLYCRAVSIQAMEEIDNTNYVKDPFLENV